MRAATATLIAPAILLSVINDAWWDMAETATGKAKAGTRERAGRWYDKDYYRTSPGSHPTGPPSDLNRVYLGGSCGNPAVHCRSAHRNYLVPGRRGIGLDFRLCLNSGLADK